MPETTPGDTPASEPPEEALTWQFYADAKEGVAWLVYGIPETDATTVSMACRKQKPGNVELTFYSGPAGLEAGTDAQVILRLPDWSVPTFRGSVDERGLVMTSSGIEAGSLFAGLGLWAVAAVGVLFRVVL